MKIKNYKCRCGQDDFFLSTPENCIGENHVGIYCSSCGKWFKWADKDEKNLAMNCVSKIRNDLIKNGDDLIKRQDAIDACFNGKCANIYDCADAIEKLPSQQKTGKWIESEQRDRTICSVCGYWQDLKAKFLFSFCPNCGSLMRGGYTNDISDS